MSIAGLQRMLISRPVQWGLVALVSFLFAFFLFDRVVMPLYTRQGTEHAVPDLRGLNRTSALRIADSSGFVLVDEPGKSAGKVEPGMILEQRPLPGSMAKPGRKIHVVPALPAARDQAPDVVGLDLRDAQIRCKNVGLLASESEVAYSFSTSVPVGRVISQKPAAGQTVQPGSSVKLTVSMGPTPEKFFVPFLIEKPLSEARVMLREAGLKLGKIVRKETELYDAGTVISQSIQSGDEVARNTAVDVVVAIKARSTDDPAKEPE